MPMLKNPSATSRWPTPYSTLDFLSIAISCPLWSKLVSLLFSAYTLQSPASVSLPAPPVCRNHDRPLWLFPKSYLASVDTASFPWLTSMRASVSTSFPDWLLPFPAVPCMAPPQPSGLLPQSLPLAEKDINAGFKSQRHRALRPWDIM